MSDEEYGEIDLGPPIYDEDDEEDDEPEFQFGTIDQDAESKVENKAESKEPQEPDVREVLPMTGLGVTNESNSGKGGKRSSASDFKPEAEVTRADVMLYALRFSIAISGVGAVGRRLQLGGTETSIRTGLVSRYASDYDLLDIKRSITCVMAYVEGIVNNSSVEDIQEALMQRFNGDNSKTTYEQGGWDTSPDDLYNLCVRLEETGNVADTIIVASGQQINGPTPKGQLRKSSSTLQHYFGLWAPGFYAFVRMVSLMERSGIGTYSAMANAKGGTVDAMPVADIIVTSAHNIGVNYPAVVSPNIAIATDATKRSFYETSVSKLTQMVQISSQMTGAPNKRVVKPFFSSIPSRLFPSFPEDKYSAESDQTVIRNDRSMQMFCVLSSMLTASSTAITSLYIIRTIGVNAQTIQNRLSSAAPYAPRTLSQDTNLLEQAYLALKLPTNSDVGYKISKILRRTKITDFPKRLRRGPLAQLIQLSQYASNCIQRMWDSGGALRSQYVSIDVMVKVYEEMYHDLVMLSSSGRVIDKTFEADDVLALSSLSSVTPSFVLADASKGSFWDPN